MKKRWLFLTIAILSTYISFAQEFAIDTVYFEFDRYDIKEKYQTELDSIIALFSEYPSYYVEITGHTDSIGSEAYNQALSEQRALSIYSYMAEHGLHPKRMSYQGFGTTRPVAPNTSFLGRMKNRRADMAVIFSTEPLEPPIAEIDSSELLVEAEPEIDPLVPVEQSAGFDAVAIDTRNLNVITGPQGTRVTIPANVFNTKETALTFELKELFNKKDIILASMPTVDKTGPLETVGMVEINAYNARKRPVKLKKGMAIKIEVPTTRRDQNMSVYRGTGGSRGGRRGRGSRPTPAINPVNLWQELAEVAVGYRGNMYQFQAPSLTRFNVGRPLYYSQDTDEDAKPIDFSVKLKGKRFERNTSVMLVGDVVRTFIPLKKQSTRIYQGQGIKYLDKDSKLILVAIQYDNDNTPYFTKREFRVGAFLKDSKKGSARIKIKTKFRRLKDNDELMEKINEL